MTPGTLTDETLPASEIFEPRDPTAITYKRIPLSWIREDHETQVRGAVSSARVRDLNALMLENGTDLDPVDLFIEPGLPDPSINNPFILADGWHRVAAYRSAGKSKVPARLHYGTKSEAIEFGLRKNGKHGSPMTSKEKRHATEVAVLDTRLGEYPDARIAKLIGVSASLVSQVRRGLIPVGQREDASQLESPETPETGAGASASSKPSRRTAASGKRESSSTAPASSRARERKPLPETLSRPTKAAMLKQLDDWINLDCISEQDVIDRLSSGAGRYVFLPKDGDSLTLKVVGTSGREQVSVPVTIKEILYEQVTFKYTAGKLREE